MMEKTKTIAFYLPQFHEIEENNEWWGKGFTEWTNVANAKPLFKGHYQPRKPLNNNYYNLKEKHTVEWQTQLMKDYGIDAFAYYHYWFNGKLLLETPAENLLTWREINQNFMFFWANHTWYKAKKGRRKILIEQTYGGVNDWENHYIYMRRFFKDQRYIKIENKPIIGIYMAEDIPDIDKMISAWTCMAQGDGFDGIYVVESINSFSDEVVSNYTKGVVLRQPNLARIQEAPKNFISKSISKLDKLLNIERLKLIDYKKIAYYEKNVNVDDFSLKNAIPFYCISTGWDNTPRHGRRGQAMINMTPELFGRVVYYLYSKSLQENRAFMFINAWNEWAEGMILEPDEQYGYQYLQVLHKALYDAEKEIDDANRSSRL